MIKTKGNFNVVVKYSDKDIISSEKKDEKETKIEIALEEFPEYDNDHDSLLGNVKAILISDPKNLDTVATCIDLEINRCISYELMKSGISRNDIARYLMQGMFITPCKGVITSSDDKLLKKANIYIIKKMITAWFDINGIKLADGSTLFSFIDKIYDAFKGLKIALN